VPEQTDKPLAFLRADSDGVAGDQPFVVVVRTRDQLDRWLRDCSLALQWIQVEGLLGDPDAWALAAQRAGEVPLDIVLSEPGGEFADLYRLVDVCAVRDVRVSMPTTPGFLKALRLAASLGLPVRLLPGQPSPEALEELATASAFYLHDPMVEAPIEFFHSTLAWMLGAPTKSLWTVLEEDPAIFQPWDVAGLQKSPRGAEPPLERASSQDFVPAHLARLIDEGAECASCPWQQLCQGYFKWPDPSYSCRGVKQLFSALQVAADEIERDLAGYEGGTTCLIRSTHGE
jgi:hypothetical protein